MPTLQIVPHLGLSAIRFGMSRAACRHLIGPAFTPFSRAGEEFLEVDAFESSGLQLSFAANNTLELIEAHAPIQVEYEGVPLVGRQLGEAVADLERLGVTGVPDDVGVDYRVVGIGLYAPEGVVEAVSLYPEGYYDD